jgi:L,D-transpeptidase catalytic domain
MWNIVSSKSPVKTNSMKKSVSRLIIAAAIILAPVMMAGKKASLPVDKLSYENVLRFTPGFSAVNSISNSEKFYVATGLENFGITRDVFEMALRGFEKLSREHRISADSILTIVDFSKSSRQKRMVVIDLKSEEVLFNTVVAHGRNTGAEFARSFSNQPRSNKSSLGFYVTRETYRGSNGYSLKLDGQEKGFNDLAMSRAIVMHAADYANEEVIGRKGYLGRSYGCPAVPEKLSRGIIDRIKNGNVVFLYYPDSKYLSHSKLLNG